MNALEKSAGPIAKRLQALYERTDGPILVAIDGRSGTGKSTFAALIGSQTRATVVAGDDFFAGGVEVLDRPAEDLADICIDRKRLRRVLETLKAGREAFYPAVDWKAFDGRLAEVETRLEPRPVLIVEGVYANHPDVRDLVDFSVLVETPDAIRRRRLIEREGALSDWERQWHRAEDWYFANLSGPDAFDAVIRNV